MGRWARLSMTIIVAAAVVVGGVTLVHPGSVNPARTVTVEPGESLLSIAIREMPGIDPADALARLQQFNGLPGPQVASGVVIRIPAR